MSAPDQQPVGTPDEQTEHRDVPTVTEHNQHMQTERPGECVGGPR